MNEFSTYEYAVRQKIEGRWIVARAGLIFLYIAYVAAGLVLGLRTRIVVPLLAFVPVTLCILIFITWRYVSVEYEYSVTSGVLTFTKIYGGRSRHRVMELKLRDAVLIAPLGAKETDARATQYHPEREFEGISSLRSPDVFFLLFEYEDPRAHEKRRAIYYFEATEKMLRICRYYNPAATVNGTTRY